MTSNFMFFNEKKNFKIAGLVQVANWKALPFDQITDNLDDTVESLLKDISNHITLKILTKQFVIFVLQLLKKFLKYLASLSLEHTSA